MSNTSQANRAPQVKRPYLVQRGKFRKYDGYVRLYEAVVMDYMGSTEFEIGTQAVSLEAMFNMREQLQVRLVDMRDVDPNAPGKLKVYSALDDENFARYVESLKYLRAGTNQFRTKEGVRFDVYTARDMRSIAPDFWWDIQQHVMWTFHPQAAHDLPHLLEHSWVKMGLLEQPSA